MEIESFQNSNQNFNQNIKSPESLFNIVAKSPAINLILKNIAKKSSTERRKWLEKLTEPAKDSLKQICIDIFLPELDEYFKGKLELQNKIYFSSFFSDSTANHITFDSTETLIAIAFNKDIAIYWAYKSTSSSNEQISQPIAKFQHDSEIVLCEFLPDNQTLITSTRKALYKCDLKSKDVIKIFNFPANLENSGNTIAISQNKSFLAAFIGANYVNKTKNQLVIYNLCNDEHDLIPCDERFNQISFGQNSNLLILTDLSGNILIYDIDLMQKITKKNILLKNSSRDKKWANLAIGNKYILVNNGYEIYLLNFENEEKIKIFYDEERLTYHHALSTNNLIAFTSRKDGKIYCAQLNDLINTDPSDIRKKYNTIFSSSEIKTELLNSRNLSFSPDNKYLIIGDQNNINIVNLETKKIIQTMKSHFVFIYKTLKGMAQDLNLEKILDIVSDRANNNSSSCNVM